MLTPSQKERIDREVKAEYDALVGNQTEEELVAAVPKLEAGEAKKNDPPPAGFLETYALELKNAAIAAGITLAIRAIFLAIMTAQRRAAVVAGEEKKQA